MKDAKNLTVCIQNGADEDEAAALAQRLGVLLSTSPGEELTVLFNGDGVSLTGYGLCYRGDFSQMLRRIENGRLQHEMLVHIAKTKAEHPRAIDATAGMGEDSLLLAAYGYDVTLYEQDPVIAVLLKDALKRAESVPELCGAISRMHLVEGSSIELMKLQPEKPDLIYLDPMFPARQKSGLINKKLQLIQKLEQPCPEENELFDAAFSLNPKKIVIKRPLKGAFLAQKKPHYSTKGKAIRYDCFVFPQND